MQTPAPQVQKAPAERDLVVRQGNGQIIRTNDPVIAGTPGSQPITISLGPPGSEVTTIPAPRTARDIDALKARRDELSNQLQSVDSRRSKLINQLKQTSDPTAIKGLESRLSLLDARQLQLESDIQQTGQQLTSPAAGLLATTATSPASLVLGRGT